MNKKIQFLRGLSLIEFLVYMSILAATAGLMTGILFTVTRVSQRETASAEVAGQLNFVMQTIQRLVESSSNIEMNAGVAASNLKLRMKDSAKDPTCISLTDGVIKLAEGPAGGAPQNCASNTTNLTNSRVVVNTLNFTKFSQYPGHDTVSIDLTMSYNTANPQEQVQRSLQSAIARVSAATFDSNLLPGSSNWNIGGAGAPWQRVVVADGSLSQPSFTFANSQETGLFNAAGVLNLVAQGIEGLTININGNVVAKSGDLAITTQNKGLILRATDGANCFRLTVNNSGALVTTTVSCP